MPPWRARARRAAVRARPRTIAGRGRTSRRGRPRRARSARTASARAPAARPGRRPRRPARPSPVGGARRCGRGSRCPAGVWRSAFSIRLIASRCSSSRAPSTGAGLDVERDLVVAADRPELAGGLDDDLREVARLACGAARPASVRASSSRSATSRRMRCEERSAERAASACSPSQRSASSSRFASTLVSGVRSSCEASATNWRWRASIASVSPRAASSSRSMPSSVRASSATSSSASRLRACCATGSRVRAISRAARRELRDRRHRAARDRHAGEQRERRAGEHAEQQEQLDAADRRLDVGRPARRTGRSRVPIERAGRGRYDRAAARSRGSRGPSLGSRRRRSRSAGALAGSCAISAAVEREHPDRPRARRREREVARAAVGCREAG